MPTIDAYLFYPLEMGEVIDSSIYRNTTVNSFILAFSVLGCIKILFWLRIIGLPGNKKSLDNWKLVFIAITFMFEDGPEILLEYFYVEKYISKQIAWYLLVRDVILCIIALYSIVVSLIWLVLFGLQVRRRYQQETFIPSYPALDCTVVVNGGCCLLIGFCNFLRTGGAGYQYVTGKLRRSCFEVFDGVLRQTPFTAGCMREVDYFIIVLCGLAIFLSVFSLAITNYIIHVIKKKTEENLHEKYWDIAENVLQSFFQYFVKSVIRWLLLKITLPQLSYFPQNKKICTLQKTYFSIKMTFSQLEFSICCFSVFRFVIIC